ncbi:MAG TPA: acyl-CoA thioesterase II [Longimicrobiaceae bacterium]|nr:acyl-CoA thioesterase II [Longimicrobiaceae bacterium]
MSYTLGDLLDLLDLEEIEQNIFRGRSRDIGSRSVFGGQVLAQALVAAGSTVEEERTAHSLHGYFILPGDLGAPIVYFVDRLRDGRSFATRRVTAIQHGRAIFNMAASFQVEEEGPEHQAEMPDVPPPEELPRELDLIRRSAGRIPERVRALYTQERPIEVRPIDPVDPFAPEPRPPLRQMWLRAVGTLPDEPLKHQSVLAYASDYGLLGAALLPHALSFQMPQLQAATLDHALWFHRRFRADEWLLYSIDSPSAAGARGFTRGSIFARDGALVASVAQEGLIRLRAPGERRER